MPTIECPHPDIERAAPREKVDHALRLPSRGMSPDTGVIVYIPGFGFRFNADAE